MRSQPQVTSDCADTSVERGGPKELNCHALLPLRSDARRGPHTGRTRARPRSADASEIASVMSLRGASNQHQHEHNVKPTEKRSGTDKSADRFLTIVMEVPPTAGRARRCAQLPDMAQSKHEQELRALARERIAKGELPGEPALRMWGGDGTGRHCSLCREPVQPGQIEFEVESDGHSLIFHRVCQSVWQLECVSHGPREPGEP